MRGYFRTDPQWVQQFSDVWLWSEWPGREGRPDTGIDLVTRERDSDGLTAIQCKFYAPDTAIQRAHIDSFFTASGRTGFSRRIVVSTSDGWSKNAEDALADQQVQTQRLDVAYLSGSTIDWSDFSWATPSVLPTHGPKQLRPHQARAIDDVRAGLAASDRGKLIMACGTGKTFTSLRIAEDMVGAGGSVLFLVPSISPRWLVSAALLVTGSLASRAVRPSAASCLQSSVEWAVASTEPRRRADVAALRTPTEVAKALAVVRARVHELVRAGASLLLDQERPTTSNHGDHRSLSGGLGHVHIQPRGPGSVGSHRSRRGGAAKQHPRHQHGWSASIAAPYVPGPSRNGPRATAAPGTAAEGCPTTYAPGDFGTNRHRAVLPCGSLSPWPPPSPLVDPLGFSACWRTGWARATCRCRTASSSGRRPAGEAVRRPWSTGTARWP